jgi:hypothetical protein
MKSAAQVNWKKKKDAFAETIEFLGICPSCENPPLSSYIHDSRTPMSFCEGLANKDIPKAATKTGIKQEVITSGQVPSERYNGLCTTCEVLNDCVFPKDEAGIWHCEEYR